MAICQNAGTGSSYEYVLALKAELSANSGCVLRTDLLDRYPEWGQTSWSKSSNIKYHSSQNVCHLHLKYLKLYAKRSSVADIIRSCLGPKAMLKMLLDPMGGIVLTNDGHAILREIEVAHPAAKSMIELSRTQDEEVGDGTTTVIILGMKPPVPRYGSVY